MRTQKKWLLLILSVGIYGFCLGQSIGIGTNKPDSSAILEISDTTRGLIIPRMTRDQRLRIIKPAIGLLIYQTDFEKGIWYCDNTIWKPLIVSQEAEIRRIRTVEYLRGGF